MCARSCVRMCPCVRVRSRVCVHARMCVCVCVYVCVCACVCECARAGVCASAYVCVRAHVCVCVRTCVCVRFVCVYVCVRVRVCAGTHVCVQVHVCMHVCVHACTSVRALWTYVCACVLVWLCVCVRVCVCLWVCVCAHMKGLKTPFILVSFLSKRASLSSCLSSLGALRGGLGGFPGLCPFMLTFNRFISMWVSRGPCSLIIEIAPDTSRWVRNVRSTRWYKYPTVICSNQHTVSAEPSVVYWLPYRSYITAWIRFFEAI